MLKWSASIGAVLVVVSAQMSPARAIWAFCEAGIVDDDMFVSPDHDLNSPYLRYAATEYVDGLGSWYSPASYVAAWVTRPDPATGNRDLRWAHLRVPDGECRPVPNPSGGSATTVGTVEDVSWVHHGGHIPAGRYLQETYPAHGYVVWSDLGDKHGIVPPRVYVERFQLAGGVLQRQRVPLSDSPAGGGITGLLPSMASNMPVPIGVDLATLRSANNPFSGACVLARILPGVLGEYFTKRCDYGHRLLLVYAGAPEFRTTGQVAHIETLDCTPAGQAGNPPCPFWMAYSIRYVLFTPTGTIIAQGTIADVRQTAGNEGPDPGIDRTLYPEVAWNEATRQWNIMWEEHYLREVDEGAGPQVLPVGVRRMATVDEQGTAVVTDPWRRCHDPGSTPTVIGPPKAGDEPPPHRYQEEYCYPINLAHDYYADDAISLPEADRNPQHNTLVRAYSWYDPRLSHHVHWVEEDCSDLVLPLPEHFTLPIPYEGSKKPNIEPIGWPWIRQQGYENASYVKVSASYDGFACRNRINLLVDDPDQTYEGSYHHVDIETPRPCENTNPLATSSGLYTFVHLFVEQDDLGNRAARFSSYYYVP